MGSTYGSPQVSLSRSSSRVMFRENQRSGKQVYGVYACHIRSDNSFMRRSRYFLSFGVYLTLSNL